MFRAFAEICQKSRLLVSFRNNKVLKNKAIILRGLHYFGENPSLLT